MTEEAADGVRLTTSADNIGPSLEWYVADLLQREFGASAEWSVRVQQIPTGGDFDVLAWMANALVYVELKSGRPQDVDGNQLRNFLQRSEELMPELAILLIDTDADLSELRERLFQIMLPLMRLSCGAREPDWPPDGHFIKPVPGFAGISYGYFRTYLTTSAPSIETQLATCLPHYQSFVRGQAFWEGYPINFVTGEVQVPD